MRDEIKYIVKYVVVNGAITVFNFLLFVIFNEIFNVWYIVSNIAAYLIAVIVSYFVTGKIVFDRNMDKSTAMPFFCMKLVMGLLSTVMLWILAEKLYLNKYVANIIITVVFVCISYIWSKMIFVIREKMKNICALFRIKHWLKNALIFIPAVCGNTLFAVKDNRYNCILIFAAMCFLSSAVYIINDINDYENDKKNPRKQNSVIVSGKVELYWAKKYCTLCIGICFIICLLLFFVLLFRQWMIGIGIMLLYFILNVGYSVWKWKEIPILELMIVVLGYLLRIEIGQIVRKPSSII